MYEDLDAPQSSNWPPLLDNGVGSAFGGSSSSQKWSKCADGNEKNPGYPPRESTGFARPIAKRYYAHRSMDMLECTFLDYGLDRYVELYKDLYCKFMKSFDEFEKHSNYKYNHCCEGNL
jgi:hypothetical protein